jgi:hypothetical protein
MWTEITVRTSWSPAGRPSAVKVYSGTAIAPGPEPASTTFDPFGGVTMNGVFVG